MFEVGIPELIVIFLAIFLLFGPDALIKMARTLGETVKNFRKGMEEMQKEIMTDNQKIAPKSDNPPTPPSSTEV